MRTAGVWWGRAAATAVIVVGTGFGLVPPASAATSAASTTVATSAISAASTTVATTATSAASTSAAPSATVAAQVNAAAQVATSQGYRTGVAVLDLRTGQYAGAGDDTAEFASESVVKVLIAANLLATGQMTGATEATAYQMITESDDQDADDLYGLTPGDGLVAWAEQRYDIPFLGGPPLESGWWGGTEITAKGMVYLYAAIARDSAVGPWLMNAMAHMTPTGADGTDQVFGIPAVASGAAVKQGWGDDGADSPNAVFNSTGYVQDGRYAVAILTDGPPDSYGAVISSVVTAQARALMPGGVVAAVPVAAPTSASTTTVSVPPAAGPSTAGAAAGVGTATSAGQATPPSAPATPSIVHLGGATLTRLTRGDVNVAGGFGLLALGVGAAVAVRSRSRGRRSRRR